METLYWQYWPLSKVLVMTVFPLHARTFRALPGVWPKNTRGNDCDCYRPCLVTNSGFDFALRPADAFWCKIGSLNPTVKWTMTTCAKSPLTGVVRMCGRHAWHSSSKRDNVKPHPTTRNGANISLSSAICARRSYIQTTHVTSWRAEWQLGCCICQRSWKWLRDRPTSSHALHVSCYCYNYIFGRRFLLFTVCNICSILFSVCSWNSMTYWTVNVARNNNNKIHL